METGDQISLVNQTLYSPLIGESSRRVRVDRNCVCSFCLAVFVEIGLLRPTTDPKNVIGLSLMLWVTPCAILNTDVFFPSPPREL